MHYHLVVYLFAGKEVGQGGGYYEKQGEDSRGGEGSQGEAWKCGV